MITADQKYLTANHQLAEALGLEIRQLEVIIPRKVGDQNGLLKAEEPSRNRTLLHTDQVSGGGVCFTQNGRS